MKIEVTISKEIDKYLEINKHGNPFILSIENNKSIKHLMEELGIPEKYVSIILVNMQHKSTNYVLKDGDKLSLFPAVAGG